MKESEIEQYLVWCVEKKLNGRTYKFTSPSNRGVADRVVCMPDGSTWFIELKKPKGGRLSPLQQIFAGEMLMLNQNYACLWTKEQVEKWASENTKKPQQTSSTRMIEV